MTTGAGRRVITQLGEEHIRQLHALYQGEWWSNGRSLEETRRVVAGSLCFAVVDAADEIVAFLRVITDGVFKALVFDVIVAPAHRGEKLGDKLIEALLAHETIRRVRHVELYCLPEMFPYYRRHGFTDAVGSLRLMRRTTPA